MKGTSAFDTVPRWRMSFGLNGKNPSVQSVWNELFHSSLLDMNHLALMEYGPELIIQRYLRKISSNYLFVEYCGAFWELKWLGGRKYILVRWNKPKKSKNQAIEICN